MSEYNIKVKETEGNIAWIEPIYVSFSEAEDITEFHGKEIFFEMPSNGKLPHWGDKVKVIAYSIVEAKRFIEEAAKEEIELLKHIGSTAIEYPEEKNIIWDYDWI